MMHFALAASHIFENINGKKMQPVRRCLYFLTCIITFVEHLDFFHSYSILYHDHFIVYVVYPLLLLMSNRYLKTLDAK